MNKWQVKYTGVLIFISIILVLGACSNDKNANNEENGNENIGAENAENNSEDGFNENEQGNNEQEEDTENNSFSVVEHQKGLKMGETGTVVSGTISENDRYEVTLNDMELLTEVEGETMYNEVFIRANVTIKNIDEKPISLDDIFTPTVGDEDLEDIELFPEFNAEFYTDDHGTAFEGNEIAPGEQVIVDYYFDTVEADYYRFAFGNPIDQIVTFANWKIKKEEM